jgi:hypothetical protein
MGRRKGSRNKHPSTPRPGWGGARPNSGGLRNPPGGRFPNEPIFPWEGIEGGYSRRAWYKRGAHKLPPDEQLALVKRINAERQARRPKAKPAPPPKPIRVPEIKIPAGVQYGVDRKDYRKQFDAAVARQYKERRQQELQEYFAAPTAGPCRRCGMKGAFCECVS